MIRINKTSRREGFQKLSIPKGGGPTGGSLIGNQIPKALGPIKVPKVPKVPKLPKVKIPKYGGFPPGHVY